MFLPTLYSLRIICNKKINVIKIQLNRSYMALFKINIIEKYLINI